MGKKKTHINIIIIGHVDSGKSTTTGYVIYKCGENHEKFKKEAAEMSKGSIKFAWVLDKMKAERKCGITMTSPYGSDCATLIVASSTGMFEAGISKNRQTCGEYATGLHAGCEATHHGCQQDGLRQTHPQHPMLPSRDIAQHPHAWSRSWKVKRKEGNATGMSVLEALGSILPPTQLVNEPLRLPLQGVHMIGSTSSVPVGCVETSFLKPGMEVTFDYPKALKSGDTAIVQI
ncbi:hypothetical protein EI555_003466 [Monodon monoceros]|uniref:Tr-type G domain-containing protein n=1 Tax=Monodon monoceros TaxID=40151 RepID=A0A4U1FS89_MONMO|nr:hypothetical protein EI555_003466 [Monodon monoceros]